MIRPTVLLMSALLIACGGNTDKATTDTSTAATTTTGASAALPDGVYHVYYAAWPDIGIDQRPGSDATFDGGALQSYTASADEAPTLGSMTAYDVATLDGSGVGRWSDGDMEGAFYSLTPLAFGADEGFHYTVTNTPDLVGPYGLAGVYTTAHSTTPTGPAGAGLGTLDGFTIEVTPGDPPLFSVDLQVSLGGESYSLVTVDEPANVFDATVSLSLSSTTGGAVCGATPCFVYLQGAFSDGGQKLNLAWQFSGSPDRISGSAILLAP